MTQKEIQRLQANMTATLVASVTVPETILSVPVVDLFALEEHTQPCHGKKPQSDNDLDAIDFMRG